MDIGSLRPAGEMRTGDQLIIKALKEESSRRWAEAARLGLATPGHNRLTEPEPLLSHVTGVPPPELTHDLLSMAFQQGYLLRALSAPGQAIGGATCIEGEGRRLMMFQLSGFYCRALGHFIFSLIGLKRVIFTNIFKQL